MNQNMQMDFSRLQAKTAPLINFVSEWYWLIVLGIAVVMVLAILLVKWVRRPIKPKVDIESGMATRRDLIRWGLIEDRSPIGRLGRWIGRVSEEGLRSALKPKPKVARDLSDPGGVVIGQHTDKYGSQLLIDRSPLPIIFAGVPGSGKTWSFLMSTILRTWVHSIKGMDIKGEISLLAQGTRFWRSNVIIDPLSDETAHFNPFNEVPPEAADHIAMCQNLAGAFPDNPETADQGGDKIWDSNSTAYMASAISYILNFLPDSDKNIPGLMKFLAMGQPAGMLMTMNQHPDPVIRDFIRRGAARLWENDNDKYVGSITATIDMYLKFYEDPRLAAMVSTSDFLIEDLQCADRPMALWMVIRDSDRERMNPIQRMVNQCIRFKLRSHEKQSRSGLPKKWHLLGIEDEFNQAGVDRDLEKSLPLMRSYMQRWVFALQVEGKIERMYGPGNLIQGLAKLVSMKVQSQTAAESLVKRFKMVQKVVESTSSSTDEKGWSKGKSQSFTTRLEHEKTAFDMLTMPKDTAYVFGHEDMVIKTERPSLSVWQGLVFPQPTNWSPLVMEMLPLRDSEGVYLGSPHRGTDINHWHGVNHTPPRSANDDTAEEVEEEAGEEGDDPADDGDDDVFEMGPEDWPEDDDVPHPEPAIHMLTPYPVPETKKPRKSRKKAEDSGDDDGPPTHVQFDLIDDVPPAPPPRKRKMA